MKIYLGHPISGLSYEEVVSYFLSTAAKLREMGYEVFHPMTGKGVLRNEKKFRAEGYGNPVSTNHAIVRRDKWMVEHADIFFLNLEKAKEVSIGGTAELAWAYSKGTYSIVVLPKQSPMRHAFILEMADIVFETTQEAINYLEKLVKGDL